MWLFELFFLSLANLICRGTDISKYFRESLGIRDNESRLYLKKKGLNKLRFTNFKCILEVYSMEGLLLESDMYVKFKFASYMEFRHFIQGLK